MMMMVVLVVMMMMMVVLVMMMMMVVVLLGGAAAVPLVARAADPRQGVVVHEGRGRVVRGRPEPLAPRGALRVVLLLAVGAARRAAVVRHLAPHLVRQYTHTHTRARTPTHTHMVVWLRRPRARRSP